MRNTDKPIIVRQTFNSGVEALWKVITDIHEMKQWYFENIPNFKAEVVFETAFEVHSRERVFPHRWKIIEVIPNQKIVYNWSYDNYPGKGIVEFEISTAGEQLKLTLTNHVTKDFPDEIPEFKRERCVAG